MAFPTLTNLADTVPAADLAKCQPELQEFLRSTRLWGLASYGDASVRRSIYRLLILVLAKRKDTLDAKVVSAHLLTSGLHADQTGSSYDYVKAVASLSAKIPSVWREDYQGTGKKSARSRLCYFLRRGSQNGPADYWKQIEFLINVLPPTLLIEGSEAAPPDGSNSEPVTTLEILNALHEGVVNKDEPRTNSSAAWQAYLMSFERMIAWLKEDSRLIAIKSHVLPLIAQHIRPSYEHTAWSVAGPESQTVCVIACLCVLREHEELFLETWRGLSLQIIEDLKTSLPEQSKDYVRSQDSLVAETGRWYALQSTLFKQDRSTLFQSALSQTLSTEIEAMITTLKNRNGKPYAAAAALDRVIQLFPDKILANNTIKTRLHAFANEAIPQLVLSPSAKYLIHSLDLLQWTCDVRQGIVECTKSLAEAPISQQRSTALRTLLASSAMKDNGILASLATKILHQAIDVDEDDDWKTVGAVLGNSEAPRQLTDDMLTTLTAKLTLDQRPASSLHGLELLSADRLALIQEFSTTPGGSSLISRLLFLADNTEGPMKQQSQALSSALQSVSFPDGAAQISNSGVKLIREIFEEVTPESLS